MMCTQCNTEHAVLFMCDQLNGEYCEPCFMQTACGQGLHEEGCATTVFEMVES